MLGIAGMLATPSGSKLRRGLVFQCTVRAALVVIQTPPTDDISSFVQCSEPVLVQALVAEFAIKTLNVGVLRGFARLDEP